MGKPVQGLGILISLAIVAIAINYLIIVGIIALIQTIWVLGVSSWYLALPVYLILGVFGKLPTTAVANKK
jgi:hypothetical protein